MIRYAVIAVFNVCTRVRLLSVIIIFVRGLCVWNTTIFSLVFLGIAFITILSIPTVGTVWVISVVQVSTR